MELQEMPIAETPESENISLPVNEKVDRIAFELWQRGSLPEVATTTQAELEDVASHSSCL